MCSDRFAIAPRVRIRGRLKVSLLTLGILSGCGGDDGGVDPTVGGGVSDSCGGAAGGSGANASATQGGTDHTSLSQGNSDSTGDPTEGSAGTGEGEYQDISIQSEITRVQPMTGIVMWADSWNDHPIKTDDGNIQLEYAYVQPSSIVSGPSSYNWGKFDQLLDDIAGRGHQAVIRFFYTYPGFGTAVPQYIKDLPGYQEEQGLTEGQTTWFPDWTHPALEEFHLEFYSKFGERYDQDPRVAFLQVGFGLWAEYHIYDGPNTIGVNFPTKSFQNALFDHLEQTLPTLLWSISIDAGDDYYSSFADDPTRLELRFGNFDDSFMHEEHDDYNAQMWDIFGHEDRYALAPHGGELSYYSDYDQEHVLDIGGMYGRTYEELSAQYNVSYMIGNDQPGYQSTMRIREAGMANGYRFAVTSFRSRASSSLVEVRNDGIAPLYYDAFVSVDGTRSPESLRDLLPGQTQEYRVPAGGVAPTLTMQSDRLVAGQVIEFAANLP